MIIDEARKIVTQFYEDVVFPKIEGDYGQAEEAEAVTDGIRKMLEGFAFLSNGTVEEVMLTTNLICVEC